jgi:hypothetical protein
VYRKSFCKVVVKLLKDNMQGLKMKKILYMSCIAILICKHINGAAQEYRAGDIIDAPPQGPREVCLELISNGMRTKRHSGCHSPVSGMLWDCKTETGTGVLEIMIPSPGPDGRNVEKLVNARIPFRGAGRIGHLRTGDGIFYITRTETDVFVERQHHEKVTEVVRFSLLPFTAATVNLLLELSTKGECVVSCPQVDKSRPAELAPSASHTPPAASHRRNR